MPPLSLGATQEPIRSPERFGVHESSHEKSHDPARQELALRVEKVIRASLPRRIRFCHHNEHIEGEWIGFSLTAKKNKWEFLIRMPDPLTDVVAIERQDENGRLVRGYTASIVPVKDRQMKTFTLGAFMGTCYFVLSDNLKPTCYYKRNAFTSSCCVVSSSGAPDVWQSLNVAFPDNVRRLDLSTTTKWLETTTKWLEKMSASRQVLHASVVPNNISPADVRDGRSTLMGRGGVKRRCTADEKQPLKVARKLFQD